MRQTKNGRRRGGAVTSVRSISSWADRPPVGGKRASCCLPICWANRCSLSLPHNPHRQTIICEEDNSAIASPRKRCMSAHKALALYLIAPCISAETLTAKQQPQFMFWSRAKKSPTLANGWVQLRRPRGQKKVQCDLRATIKCNKSK